MPISEKDKEFIDQVAAYYRTTKDEVNPEGSIRDTAIKFSINRNKVRKILITTGDITSPITERALELRKQGMSVETIAARLGVSTATISTYLPYKDLIKDSLDPSDHTQAVRDYRAYQKERAKSQVQNKKEREGVDTSWKEEWKKEIKMSYTKTATRPARPTWKDADLIRKQTGFPDGAVLFDEAQKLMQETKKKERAEIELLRSKEALSEPQQARLKELETKYGYFPGALTTRQAEDLEHISGERLPYAPREVVRLHLELEGYLRDEEQATLQKYGNLKYGNNISRDVVVPMDIPLYAIHYLIQRLFGWQNSHLHKFELPEEVQKRLTEERIRTWSQLVGIVFRSPYMDEDDELWADDYESGSFKNWLTKKYTGPYLSQCHGEGFIQCQCDLEDLFKEMLAEEEVYVVYAHYSEDDVRVITMAPVYDAAGKKRPEPECRFLKEDQKRVEIVKLSDAPVEALSRTHERGCFDLLERLPLDSVMTVAPEKKTGTEMLEKLDEYIVRLRREAIDAPDVQVIPEAFTDTLYYNYDFGDNWVVKITIMDDCRDLVEQGRITQDQLDKAQIKCRELYRPVTLAVDGEMLMDDVGGIDGFVNFLQTINPNLSGMSAAEKEEARVEKKEMLEWAKSVQSWKKLNPMI